MNLHKKLLNATKRGTGEAHLILKKHPTIDFSKEILEGITKNFAYDRQCEGSRERYIFELINLSKQKKWLKEQALKALLSAEENSWDLNHLYRLVGLIALGGSIKAKKYIYKRFEKDFKNGYRGEEDTILKIDKAQGLIFIAEKKGELFYKNPEDKLYYSDFYFVDTFQEENPTINVMEILAEASQNNAFIQIYFEKYKERKAKPKETRENIIWDYDIITNKINTQKFFYLSEKRVKELSEEDILKLADDFLKEVDEEKRTKYLRIFRYIKFPYDYHDIFRIVKEVPVSGRNLLVEAAIETLSHFKADDIRSFALEKLSETKNFEIYVNLLVGNYEEGDEQMLSKAIRKIRSFERIHQAYSGLSMIYEHNHTKSCKEPLEAIYQKLNCGICRGALIEILIKNDVLSDNIRKEIQFDSDESTRELGNLKN